MPQQQVLVVSTDAAWRRQVLASLESLGIGAVELDAPTQLEETVARVQPVVAVVDRAWQRQDESQQPWLLAQKVGTAALVWIESAADRQALAHEVRPILAASRAGCESQHSEREFVQLSGENERLREQARVRQEFMRNLAHELATPLTPLAGYLKLMQAGKLGELSARQQQVVTAMIGSVERLGHSIDNLVDYASLETGKYRIRPVELDASQLVDDCVQVHYAKARAKHVRVEVRRPEHLRLTGDERKLSQALSNVLDNAIRVSPHGGQVLVELAETPEAYLFSVYDQGPGLPPEVLRLADGVPMKSDEPTGRSGLGLPVVRHIVVAHGGTLFLESPPKEQPETKAVFPGSRVAFTIPRHLPSS